MHAKRGAGDRPAVGVEQRAQAERRLESAIASLSADGIPAEGTIGDADPIVAVQEAWNPGRYDEVVVSTLTEGASRWLQIDLPHRVQRLTDCQVKHVAVPERRPEDTRTTTPPPERRPMLERVASLMRSSTRRSRAA